MGPRERQADAPPRPATPGARSRRRPDPDPAPASRGGPLSARARTPLRQRPPRGPLGLQVHSPVSCQTGIKRVSQRATVKGWSQ